MTHQDLTSNSYINIASEENIIHVNNHHHVVIKTNLVHVRSIPHHIDPLGLIPFPSSQQVDNYNKFKQKQHIHRHMN